MWIIVGLLVFMIVSKRPSSGAAGASTTTSGPGGGGGMPSGAGARVSAPTGADGSGSGAPAPGFGDSVPNLNLPAVTGPGSTGPGYVPEAGANSFFSVDPVPPVPTLIYAPAPPVTVLGTTPPHDVPNLNLAPSYFKTATDPSVAYQSGGPGSVVGGIGDSQFYIAPSGDPLVIDPSSGRTAEYYNNLFGVA